VESNDVVSNSELSELRDRLNADLARRGTFTWWNPLAIPSVGTDREPRLTLHGNENKVLTDRSYTVNEPSSGSLEESGNVLYPAHGEVPGGQPTDDDGNPRTSAAVLDSGELRNLLIGLAKIYDIDLYYGRNEQGNLAFRDTADIRAKVELAEQDIVSVPVSGTTRRYDPNDGIKNRQSRQYGPYPGSDTGRYVDQPEYLPSGQYDGEELFPGRSGPDPTNFYDDYGAPVELTNVNTLTSADRKFVPSVNDSYLKPSATPQSAKTNVGQGMSNGQFRTDNLIDYTGTTGNATQTPAGKRPLGWKATPGATPEETLPGQKFQRSYNGGADMMIPGTNYGGKHPSEVSNPQQFEHLTSGGSVGVQPHLAYHPQNPYVSPVTHVYRVSQNNKREDSTTIIVEGDKDSTRFGLNPRNPNRGNEYSKESYQRVFGGQRGLCQVSCTGMCYTTCDSECTESCQSTCWDRCGDACISDCSNVCTGCSNLCYDTCKTKCENVGGLSCLNVGAQDVTHVSLGDAINGDGKVWPKNDLRYTTYSCEGCSYTCQFYPNYRTTCWDALCQNLCFYSCYSYCSTGCYGGCIDNQSQHDHSSVPLWPKGNDSGKTTYRLATHNNMARYRTGRGQACREGCVADCVGDCRQTCDGTCSGLCFEAACTKTCFDDCNAKCTHGCGENCLNVCRTGCVGSCSKGCSGECTSKCQGCSGSCDGTCYKQCTTTCKGSSEGVDG